MRLISNLALICGTLLITTSAFAADVKVIANSSVGASEISSDDLKQVFLETKTSLPGAGHVEPVLAKSGAAHDEFLKDYVSKSDSALSTYYRSLAFTGKGAMPKSFGSDADIVSYVAKTKGAIGYVGSATATAGVKTLAVK